MRASGKRVQKEATPPPSADPTVLTYLHLASKAFPLVEKVIDKQQQHMLIEALSSIERANQLETQLNTQVQRYRDELERTESDTKALLNRALYLEKQIAAEDDRFASEMVEMAQKHKADCENVKNQVAELDDQLKRAKAWEAVRKEQKEELAALQAKVSALKAQHKGEIKVMMAQHEEERRKLRDVLVKKLRNMRDQMTSEDTLTSYSTLLSFEEQPATQNLERTAQGDAGPPAPLLTSLNANQQGIQGAVKLTERLSREVTAYERESKATSSAIEAHEARRDIIMAKLKSIRDQNERLVFKNAASSQSIKMLMKRQKEMKDLCCINPSSLFLGNSNSISSNRKPNLAFSPSSLSLLEFSLVSQKQMREDLERELNMATEEITIAYDERKIAEQQLLAQIEKDLGALEFIESLEMTHAVAVKSESLRSSSGPRSTMGSRHAAISQKTGRIGSPSEKSSLPPIRGPKHIFAQQETEEMGQQPLDMLGIHTEEEITQFLGTAMNCLLASVPKDVVGNITW